MGLDSKLLAKQEDPRAIITCLAKGGPAHRSGVVQAGDHLVAVGDLDVEGLLSEECHGDDHSERTQKISQRLATALLGPEGSTVMIKVRRTGSSEEVQCVIQRAQIKPYCQWVSDVEKEV
uniref:PDZ domain-containing protein n=2 Tax=Hemiselmis andersenii TaxID=464988 RepID=A0A7S1GZT8_HEMAN|mmetsp:Transcript_2777/g.6558  ORF Transcript_2777/g.6558 Transcript_2777/m.6558 type:complete len:120 (+) Transcript_2777:3-362(+)